MALIGLMIYCAGIALGVVGASWAIDLMDNCR